jgi:hypothetical protein
VAFKRIRARQRARLVNIKHGDTNTNLFLPTSKWEKKEKTHPDPPNP